MAIKKRPVTPRQKMINLMYIVLMAMLALNISTEVLNGFSIVEESLNRTTANASKENEALYSDFASQMKTNPEKVREWFEKATQVRDMSDSLYNFAQALKVAIVKEADGPDGDVRNIENTDNLEAAGSVMLAPLTGKGGALFRAINSYRERILTFVSDPDQRRIIASNLTTAVPHKAGTLGKNWQEYMFENMPVAAAVTLLSKLQNDVRYAEGEVLHSLVSNIGLKDIRVNKLEAFVIPESRTVISGDQFNAQIVMAAVDTTQRPEIYVGGRLINGGVYRFTAGGVGEHSFGGYITMRDGRGEVIRRNFTQKYTVVAPSATVSADLMNVLYAGYENPISVSIPGVPLSSVSASMSGGSFRSVGMGRYIARPSAVGKDVTINVAANDNGRVRQMGKFTFHVRKLPDPSPYIPFKDAQGNGDRFRGGNMSKQQLMSADGIGAAIDDGILDIGFKVLSFETGFYDSRGNAVPLAGEGSNFSSRQKETFRKLTRGRRFYVSRVVAIGPDGIQRQLNNTLEVIVK